MNCDIKVMKEIAKIIEKYKDNLTKKEKEYRISFSYNTSNSYGLPKVPKSKFIQNAIKEQPKRVCTYFIYFIIFFLSLKLTNIQNLHIQ